MTKTFLFEPNPGPPKFVIGDVVVSDDGRQGQVFNANAGRCISGRTVLVEWIQGFKTCIPERRLRRTNGASK